MENSKVYKQKVALKDMYELAMQMQAQGKQTWLLIDYGPDWLYFLPAPLNGRGPRENAAKEKAGDIIKPAEGQDYLAFSIPVAWDGVPADGSEKPTRDAVMGQSAKNYVVKCYDKEFADSRSWEWLHIVGHALGGNNEVGNLLAGTYTANTQMIPYEKAIKDTLIGGGTAKCVYTCECYPGTYVGMYIEMAIEIQPKAGNKMQVLRTFNCTGDLPFDKFQYEANAFR